MRSSLIIFIISISNLFIASAQESLPLHYSKLLSSKQIQKDIEFLSSDEMEGRDTGSKGQKLAAHYIYKQFVNANLINPTGTEDSLGFFQQFSVYQQQLPIAKIKTEKQELINYKNILISGYKNYSNSNMELVFLGTAPDSSYTNKDYSNKAVLFLSSNLYAAALKSNKISMATKAKLILFCNPNQPKQYKNLLAKKRKLFTRRIIMDKEISKYNPFDSISSTLSFIQYKNRLQSYHGAISNAAASAILQIKTKRLKQILFEKSIKPTENNIRNFAFNFELKFKKINTENVLAFLPGTDKKEEIVIVSAHYDHIGKTANEIYNGANDNASGCAAMIELARKFKQASDEKHKTKRSILFAAFTGEEKGMFGSKYFVENSPFSQSKFVGNLNIDMLGRSDELHDTTDYIYLLGTNHLRPKLKWISDSINKISPKLQLDYKYDQADNYLYQASDQVSFVQKGIPAIFYFNGLHKDYHQPGDTADKIDYEAIKKVSELIFLTTWELANEN
ncbi:M28 family peptidase [Labilibaculum sp.]|uniref:M28 family metallopeptidase n=1 Tax=Labilibaculum sp. TaxID=2060723 RepID=UPI003564C8B3